LTRFVVGKLQSGTRHIHLDQDDVLGNLAIVFDMSDIQSFITTL
jgi:hypothetical protein